MAIASKSKEFAQLYKSLCVKNIYIFGIVGLNDHTKTTHCVILFWQATTDHHIACRLTANPV